MYKQNVIHCDCTDFIPGMQRWFNIRQSRNLIWPIKLFKSKKNPMIIPTYAENLFSMW